MKNVLIIFALGLLAVSCVEAEEPQCQDCFQVIDYSIVHSTTSTTLALQYDVTIITQNQCTKEIKRFTQRVQRSLLPIVSSSTIEMDIEKRYPKFSCWTGW